ncbi:hypothetical protein [Chitinophaga sp. LS1]|uniref:hypothetical protein n=1 Tax=Chitinophaga sp. LS1 TaxID=3051176 RepID=UPI002AAC195E|nr:hypothetical protein [Chitinophaga sp. LS1]WPV65663.1 hypothetical protein QQL36_28065 [Chitinophaga sp. LS1]
MSYRPSETLKPLANTLAELLSSHNKDNTAIANALEQFTLDEVIKPCVEAPEIALSPGGQIGIWKQVEQDGKTLYRRDVKKQLEWGLWANVHEIPPKSSKMRVLLFGESAARTVFYDPGYNLSMEIAHILGADVEIIDLARTSMLLRDLVPLMQSSVALEPDAVIIFAGNNWVFQLHEQEYDYQQLLDICDAEGLPGMKSFMEEEMKKIVMSTLGEIEHTFTDRQVPVLFIIPEFNLLDWKSNELEQILPVLPGTRGQEWLDARSAAKSIHPEEDLEGFGAAANKMTEADPSNPYGFELLAEYYMRTGNLEGARRCLEIARDAILFNRSSKSMPRRLKVIRETILDAAEDHGIRTLDMENIFKTRYAGQLPGRQLFLDNCHLTIEGVRLIARYASASISEILTGEKCEVETLVASPLVPGNEILAHAHFGAAIYNTHYGQSREIIEYHCNQAYMLFPGISNIMRKYIDFATRMASTLLCKSFEELITGEDLKQYMGGYTLRHPRNTKLMDITLIDAIASILKKDGIDIDQEVNLLRMKEHAVQDRPVDLLASYYCQRSYHNFFVKNKPFFFESRQKESTFYFVSNGEDDLIFDFVYRAMTDEVKITLNDQPTPVASVAATGQWTPVRFVVRKELLQAGLNELKITWPYVSQPLTVNGALTAESFLTALFPVIGEVSRLTVMSGE